MSTFKLYLQLGFEHILDLNAYDHILFLVALCAIYRMSQWRVVLILVTAFTIGHSISLLVSALEIVSIRTDIIEFLIPVTILLTCIYNMLNIRNISEKSTVSDSTILDNPEEKNIADPIIESKRKRHLKVKYGIALLFGLIHGLGFSNYLKESIGALMKGNFSITKPLFGFNVGIELGQIVIVFVILVVSYVMLNIVSLKEKHWNYAVSSLAGIVSIYLMTQTKFW